MTNFEATSKVVTDIRPQFIFKFFVALCGKMFFKMVTTRVPRAGHYIGQTVHGNHDFKTKPLCGRTSKRLRHIQISPTLRVERTGSPNQKVTPGQPGGYANTTQSSCHSMSNAAKRQPDWFQTWLSTTFHLLISITKKDGKRELQEGAGTILKI